MRTMTKVLSGLAMTSALLLPAAAQGQAQAIVAVLPLNVGSLTPGDYAGFGKGLQDMLIVDLANSGRYRVVDRSNIQRILEEQNLAKTGAIDPQTAVKIGKILGAHYMITGSVMMAANNDMIATAYAINVETSQISDGQKLQERSNDILGLVNRLNTRLISQMQLRPLGGNAPAPSTPPGGSAQSGTTARPTQAGTVAATPAVELMRKPLTQTEQTQIKNIKLDMKTALLYSKGLDALDAKDNRKAADLFKQVLAVHKDYAPAKEALAKTGMGN
jgi:TolB-like protein